MSKWINIAQLFSAGTQILVDIRAEEFDAKSFYTREPENLLWNVYKYIFFCCCKVSLSVKEFDNTVHTDIHHYFVILRLAHNFIWFWFHN